jgi:hypothetical protein
VNGIIPKVSHLYDPTQRFVQLPTNPANGKAQPNFRQFLGSDNCPKIAKKLGPQFRPSAKKPPSLIVSSYLAQNRGCPYFQKKIFSTWSNWARNLAAGMNLNLRSADH